MRLLAVLSCAGALSITPALAATETVLYTFKGGTDGIGPVAGLVAGADGALYGTTRYGGGSAACDQGCGTVFKLVPQRDGTYAETVLHAFQGGSDGSSPFTGVTLDAGGDILGVTSGGGGVTADCPGGCGTVFEIPASGTYEILHSFEAGPDGQLPDSPLFLASDGNAYGTTFLNNHNSKTNSFTGGGTVFSLRSSNNRWAYSLVRTLKGNFAPQKPAGQLAEGSDGRLYGTFTQRYTTRGGVFAAGAIGSIGLNSIGSRPEGYFGGTRVFGPQLGLQLPESGATGLIPGPREALYGIASRAADSDTVFRFTPNTLPEPGGAVTRLYTFQPKPGVLKFVSGLAIDAAENVFGSASGGGLGTGFGQGGIFKLTPPSDPSLKRYTETDLYRFTGGADGGSPNGDVLIDAGGNLYGTTFNGGLGFGVVYRITP